MRIGVEEPGSEHLVQQGPQQLVRERHPVDRHRVELATEVELGAQALAELLEHLAGAETLPERRTPLREVGEQRQRREVAGDHALDARTLDLHHHRLPRVQPGAVRLADGRRGERLPVELGEDALDRAAELGLEYRPDLFDGISRDAILERAELGAYIRGKEVDAGRGDLTELDVDPAGALQHAAEAHAEGIDLTLSAVMAGQERSEALLP